MAECITKEQVIEWFRPYGHTDEGIPYYVLVTDIREMKAADVMPVVRCKDCKYLVSVNADGKGIPTCQLSGMGVASDEFCRRGEKVE